MGDFFNMKKKIKEKLWQGVVGFFSLIGILGFALFWPLLAFGATYATWDSGVKGSCITLSLGDLKSTGNGAGWCSTQSTIAKSSGKWYWEIKVNSLGNFMTGVGGSITTTSYIGLASDQWAIFDANNSTDWRSVINNSFNSQGTKFSLNDVIGLALDLDNGTLDFYLNGVFQYQFTGITGTIYAQEAAGDSGSNAETANFGASPFAYPVPSGFCEGLSDTCIITSSQNTIIYEEATSTNRILRTIAFGEGIIMFFFFLGFVGYIWNAISKNKRKPWQK